MTYPVPRRPREVSAAVVDDDDDALEEDADVFEVAVAKDLNDRLMYDLL